MTIKVKLNANTAGIVVKPSFGVPDSPVSTVTVKNQIITVSGSPKRLDELQDVVEVNPQAGDTLVYNSDTDKYEVQRLNLTDVDGPLDGGSF
jgi:hypothetical protein